MTQITPAMALQARHSLQEAANAAIIAYYSDKAPFQQGWHLNQMAVELHNAAKALGFKLVPIPTTEAPHVAPEKSQLDSGRLNLSSESPAPETTAAYGEGEI